MKCGDCGCDVKKGFIMAKRNGIFVCVPCYLKSGERKLYG